MAERICAGDIVASAPTRSGPPHVLHRSGVRAAEAAGVAAADAIGESCTASRDPQTETVLRCALLQQAKLAMQHVEAAPTNGGV